jgi:hypothetical protein
MNTSHTPEEGAHSPSWPNGLIIIIIIIIIYVKAAEDYAVVVVQFREHPRGVKGKYSTPPV